MIPDMAYSGVEVLVAVAGISLVGITAILHVLAKYMSRELQVHDLRIRATKLRNAYVQRLAELDAAENGVEIIGSVQPLSQPSRAAA